MSLFIPLLEVKRVKTNSDASAPSQPQVPQEVFVPDLSKLLHLSEYQDLEGLGRDTHTVVSSPPSIGTMNPLDRKLLRLSHASHGKVRDGRDQDFAWPPSILDKARSNLESAILRRLYWNLESKACGRPSVPGPNGPELIISAALEQMRQVADDVSAGGQGTVPTVLSDLDSFSSALRKYTTLIDALPANSWILDKWVETVLDKETNLGTLMSVNKMTQDQARWYCILSSVPREHDKPNIASQILRAIGKVGNDFRQP